MARLGDEGREKIIAAWHASGRNKSEVVRLTGHDRGTVRRVLFEAGLDAPEARPLEPRPDDAPSDQFPQADFDPGWRPADAPPSDVDSRAHSFAPAFDEDDDVSEKAYRILRAQLRAPGGRKELERLVSEVGWREHFDRALREVVPTLRPGEPIRWNLGPSSEHESMILHLSDLHYGQVIRPEAILGLNEYNSTIARERLFTLVEKTLKLHRTMTLSGERHFDELVVALNGDLVNGLIHGAERHSDQRNVCEATIHCGLALAEAIRELARAFPQVVARVTPGNHGRLSNDKSSLDHRDGTRSFDWVAGKFAEVALRDVENVRFEFADGYTLRYEVQGYSFVQEHGNFIRSVGGLAAGGSKKRLASLNEFFSLVGGPFHYLLSGHVHVDHSVRVGQGEVLVNGSVPGVDEYAFYEHNAVGPAVQYLYCVNPDRGVTTREPVYLTPVRKNAR